jgi:hypothetical protein
MATETTPSLDELIQRADSLGRDITAATASMSNEHAKDTMRSARRCTDAAAVRIGIVKALLT